MKISVIVPVYKVEPYLRKCIDSILGQTYTDLEIILVDDGSPDNCGAICDEYAALDSRVRVVHKENGGLSDARNAGLDICTGEYIAFVDSDDWIEPQMYQRLLELLLHYDADMALGGVADDVLWDGQAKTVKTSNYGDTPFAEDNIAAMRRYFHGSWAAWDKLYKAKLFNGITYPVGEINEDEAIVLHLLDRCERVCYTNEVFYHYLKRVDGTSITTAAFTHKKLDWEKHCKDNLSFIRARYPELIPHAAFRYCSSILWSMREISLMNSGLEEAWKQLRKDLRRNFNLFWQISGGTNRMKLILFSFIPRPLLRLLQRKQS